MYCIKAIIAMIIGQNPVFNKQIKIILVSDFYDFEKTEVEKQLLDGTKKLSYVSKSLVLLHPNSLNAPSGTARHLNIREVGHPSSCALG